MAKAIASKADEKQGRKTFPAFQINFACPSIAFSILCGSIAAWPQRKSAKAVKLSRYADPPKGFPSNRKGYLENLWGFVLNVHFQ